MAKNIVICCDGTGNQYGPHNTNVVKLFERLIASDEQKIFYDPGVGTASKALLIPFQKISTALAQMFGLDLQRNVEDAYLYLMNTYSPGDQIYLFGFSRGAHTVRRLASMLEKVELLHRGSENMIPYASRMYLDKNAPDEVVEGFRKTFSRNCPVHFIGVWDTVAAVSRLLPRPKLDGIFSSEVKFAYHAVAIDERRFNFPPNLWKKETIAPDQVVEEVWFAGCHSDVGGGYQEQRLSNIPLQWILEKAQAAGLKLRADAFADIPTDPLAPQHQSWVGAWWFLPFPMYVAVGFMLIFLLRALLQIPQVIWGVEVTWYNHFAQTVAENWYFFLLLFIFLIPTTRANRVIPVGAKVHLSVRARARARDGDYQPENLSEVFNSVEWVS